MEQKTRKTGGSSSAAAAAASAQADARFNVRELLEMERQIYQENIDQKTRQHQDLLRGTQPEFVNRCGAFAIAREGEMQVAKTRLDLNMKNGNDLLAFELQLCEDAFQDERKLMKKQLLANAQRKIDRLKRKLQRIEQQSKQEASPSSPNAMEADSESTKNADSDSAIVEPESVPPIGKITKDMLTEQLQQSMQHTRRAFNLGHLSYQIPSPERIIKQLESECSDFNDRIEFVVHSPQKAPPPVHVKDGRLHIGSRVFAVGDNVLLTSYCTAATLYGQISVITEEMLTLVLICGTKANVYVDRLQKICGLRHQPPPKPRLSLHYDEAFVALNTPKHGGSPHDSRSSGRKRKHTVDIRLGF